MTNCDDADFGQLTRRDAIRLGAGAGLGLAALLKQGVGFAQAPPPQAPLDPYPNKNFPNVPFWKTELKLLAPSVYAYVQGGGPGIPNVSVSNAGCIVGPDHWMAIDALGAPMHAKAFIAAANQATGKQCRRLVITHHHGDHVTGNQFFGPIEIVGQDYCRAEVVKMAAGNTPGAKFVAREGWADGTEERIVVPPNTSFSENVTYYYGDTVVQFIANLPAHTWGDAMAYLPQHKILFAGDIFFNYVTPFGQNAHITKWLDACDRIQKMDVDIIVPGHGPIGNKKELDAMADYYRVLKAEVRKRFDAGMTPGRAAADVKMGKFENWIGPTQIVTNTVRLYAEWHGTLVPDVLNEQNRAAMVEYQASKKI